ncbi:2-methylcitrate dehydratase PrpD [Breoghania corrubedonensis]|uniref:2-methylcitrate dehydratase PrpD n=1 Tax=Breoghania corrubedonensis TaxID=665038 RepID=A0A2T5VBB3_9HYPH|nr:MmgE/PrpD family protein [Breoghania corrubedonensis]PTW61042.1 2-methylcitrate dehydratase PrpD [Breoghania corrubedonensis]
MSLIETVLDICTLERTAMPQHSLKLARFSLFDWLVCGRAGTGEPLSQKLRELATHEGGHPTASTFGGGRYPARMAALVNGATSHALDYDDTHFAHVGHLSVGIYPAAIAVAEETGANGPDVAEAFLAGAEAAIRIGVSLGAAHYNLGFHQTATAGAFGATIAAARLYGLDRAQTRAAIGLCATRASGLKSQFGTMGKPYNAGIAASNGIESASLARMGFTSCADGLDGPQGFIPTHSPGHSSGHGDTAVAEVAPLPAFLFDDVKYKFHACCHGTHAMIEGLIEALGQRPVSLETVTRITLRTNPRWLRVCDIPAPATGLEVKFSYRWLAGMVIDDRPTGIDTVYTDALAADPALIAFAKHVEIIGDENVDDMQAEGEIVLSSGETLSFSHDLARALPVDMLEKKLIAKAQALLGTEAAALQAVIWDLEDMDARAIGKMIRDAA